MGYDCVDRESSLVSSGIRREKRYRFATQGFRLAILAIFLLANVTLPKQIQAEEASLKMRFVFDGVPPTQKQILLPPRLMVPGGPLMDERLIVDPMSKGIRNVIVSVYTGRRGSKVDRQPYDGVKRTLKLRNSRFEPRVTLARAGDTLEVINLDPVLYTGSITLFSNKSAKLEMPPGRVDLFRLDKAEPGVAPASCSSHPWMKGYVVVSDHPYVSVSDEDGNVQIDGLPAGRELVFRANHESASLGSVVVDGQTQSWRGGRFKVHLKAGENDLGDVLIPEKSSK